ncbi:MAG TPA: NAD(P)-dependent oxidoreductase [Bacteroidales bacterium]|nr:NAD(P)-dependent oxidoreductase [Bacteroidales bacterium]
MKILVTGANGLVGRRIIRTLAQDKENLIYATSQKKVQFDINTNFFTVNLVYSDLNQLIETLNPDVLIHCAAMASPDACEADRYSAYKINVEVTARLAAACRDYGAHMIFLSSDFIFDGNKGNYTEEDIPSPISYYGETKVEAEKSILDLNIGASIVRTSLVFGYDEQLARPNIVLRVIDNLKKGKSFKVPIDQFRTPTDADDLAKGIFGLAQKKLGGIYNISGGQRISVYELAKQVALAFGYNDELLIPVKSVDLPEPAKRPLDSGLNIDKAIKTLNYTPTPLASSIERIKDHIR